MKLHRSSVAILLILALASMGASAATAQKVSNGVTSSGAHHVFVVPDDWNGGLIIWNHGFSLSPIGPVSRAETDLIESFATPLGYAVAASSYSQTGWALFKSNQDLEQMVTAFTDEFGLPSEVILIGASLGGIVTASALEKANLGNVVGALTICGAVAGSRNWDAALDLRLLYDAICTGKKERIPGGAKGLPKGSSVGPADVAKAVNACFGLNKNKPKNKQKKKLEQFLAAADIPAEFVLTNMNYVTFGMADLVHDKTKMKGKQGAGNYDVDYGDDEINDTIARFKPKKSKRKRLFKNYTPTGEVGDVKIVSIHTDKDGLVIVENESEWAKVVPEDQLSIGVVVEDTPSHCGFSNAELIGAFQALRDWIDGGGQPTSADLQNSCRVWAGFVGGPCRIDPNFVIPDMDGRVRPR